MSTTALRSTRLRRVTRYACLAVAAFVFLFVAHAVLAQTGDLNNFGLNEFGGQTNLGTNIALISTIARIINIALGFLGVLAVLLILYAGYLWMTARGDQEQIERAKKILSGGVIGLIIVLSAFALASFILQQLAAATNFQTGGGGGGGVLPPGGGVDFNIVATSPQSGQTGVKLCQAVQAIFNSPVDATTLVYGGAPPPPSTVRLYKQGPPVTYVNRTLNPGPSDFAVVKPDDLDQNAPYQVVTTNGIKDLSATPRSLVPPLNPWTFTTGTETDTVAPKILAGPPPVGTPDTRQPQGGNACRLPILQAKFSEDLLVSTVNTANVRLYDVTGSPTPTTDVSQPVQLGGVQLETDFRTVSATVASVLPAQHDYRVEVSGIADACSNPMVGTEKWYFTTGDTITCTPFLSDIQPPAGYSGAAVTLHGSNLGSGGSLWMNYTAIATSTWSPTAITFNLPGDIPNPPNPAAVWVTLVNQPSNVLPFTLLSPYIAWVSPGQGPVGEFVTIGGTLFGDSPGRVRFIDSANTITYATLACGSDSWSDTQVVVKVPATLSPGPFHVQLVSAGVDGTVGNADDKPSNQRDFSVNTAPLGPGLCSVAPSCMDLGQTGVSLTLTGVRFGLSQNANDNVHIDSSGIIPSQTWSDTAITAGTVPSNLTQAYHPITVFARGLESNPYNFKVPCQPGPQVVRSLSCANDSQSPSPYDGLTNACINALINVRFDQVMDPNTLVVANVKLAKCTVVPPNPPSPANCTVDVPLTNRQLTPDFLTPTGVRFQPNSGVPPDLTPDTWYMGTVSGSVKNTATPPVAMGAPYTWYFKTRVSPDRCLVNSVGVDPPLAYIRSLLPPDNTQLFTGRAQDASCNILGGYNFTWSSSNGSIATVAPLSGPTTMATAVGTSTNPAKIKATVTPSMSSTADLYVSTLGCQSNSDCEQCGAGTSSCVAGLCSPVVTGFSPTNGPIGTWLTINGCYFGTTRGDVFYSGNSLLGPNVHGLWPDAAICGPSTWNDQQIISEVPDVNGPPGNNAQTGPIKVVRDASVPGNVISANSFNVDNSPLRPGICLVDPGYIYESQINGATTVELKGMGFGLPRGAGHVTHYTFDDQSPVPAMQYNNWSVSDSVSVVPTGAPVSVGNKVEKVALTQGLESNHVDFNIIPGAPPGGGCSGVPQIEDVSPSDGISSSVTPTVVTVIAAPGTHFGTGGTVLFDDVTADQAMCGSWADTEIVVAVPPGLTPGLKRVFVKNDCGTSNPGQYVVDNTIHPGICSLSPSQGPEGTQVNITGYNFTDNRGPLIAGMRSFVSVACSIADGQPACLNSVDEGQPVNFGDGNRYQLNQPGQISLWHNNQVRFAVPHLTRTGFVRVSVDYPAGNGGLQASNALTFTAEPFITSITPATAATGAWVTVSGGNFGDCFGHPTGTCHVTFAGNSSPVVEDVLPNECSLSWSDSQIITKVPAGVSNSGDKLVRVLTTVYGITSPPNSRPFTRDDSVPVGPQLCLLTPASVPGFPPSGVTFRLDGDRLGDGSDGVITFPHGSQIPPAPAWANQHISSIKMSSADSGNVTVERDFSVVTGRECLPPCIQAGNSCVNSGGSDCWTPTSEVRHLVSNPLQLTVGTSTPGGGALPELILPSGMTSICRNALIQASFDRAITLSTVVATDFKVVRTVNTGTCGQGEQQLAATSQPATSWWRRLANLFLRPATATSGTTTCQVLGSLQVVLNPVTNLRDTLRFNEAVPLVAGTTYTVTITSSNVVPPSGVGLCSDNNGSACSWPFSIAPTAIICQVARVRVTPPSYTFTKLSDQSDFQAQPLDAEGYPITIGSGAYVWSLVPPDSSSIMSGNGTDTVSVIPQNKNGSATLKVNVSDPTYGSGDGSAALSTYLCEVPWTLDDNATTIPAPLLPYNFRLRYCRSQTTTPGKQGSVQITSGSTSVTGTGTLFSGELTAGDSIVINGIAREVQEPITDTSLTLVTAFSFDYSGPYAHARVLPDLGNPGPNPTPPPGNGLLREYFLKVPNSNDAIGVRVYSNTSRLSPRDWYNQQPDITHGNPSATTVYGYDGLKDTQSTYVGAVNQDNSHNPAWLYTNIYILSYNQGASATTVGIVQQLIKDWTFNTNLTSLDDVHAIQHDLKRLTHLGQVQATLASYAAAHGGTYPPLLSGSYIAGMSTSTWPSWQAELANELGKALPTDPLNTFNQCSTLGYDPTTCWNPSASKGPPDERFMCPDGSHVYQYVVDPSGHGYQFFMNFEYKNVRWQGKTPADTVNVLGSDICRSYPVTVVPPPPTP